MARLPSGERDKAMPLSPDDRVIEGFGQEWSRFRNDQLAVDEIQEMFDLYTSVFPWDQLPKSAEGFDAGCGSGRWARLFAPRVGLLHCIDASRVALDVSRETLSGLHNVKFRHEDLCSISLEDASCDFGYALGVLHHISDTELATATCAAKLKPGAPFLVYLYHDLEERGHVQQQLIKAVTPVRFVVARLPSRLRALVADLIALTIYWPFARLALLLARTGRDPSAIPLFEYRDRSFYVMRNDALDRFGTRLEKRYSKQQVISLLEGAGFEDVVFSDGPPWWVAMAKRRNDSP